MRASWSAPRRGKCLVLLLHASLCWTSWANPGDLYDEEVRWDFDSGLEGWAASTVTEMETEVYARGGELRGAIRGNAPHIDSPRLQIQCGDRHHVVFRAAYRGAATMGRITVRSGGQLPSLHVLDDSRGNWTPRRNITPMAASSNRTALSRVADHSPYTFWSAEGASNQWITIDAGAFLPVSRIEIDITRDEHSPRHLRLQKGLVAAGEYKNVATFAITSTPQKPLNQTDHTHVFEGFQDWSRYWRLYMDDNFGGSSIRIREVRLLGPDEGLVHVPWELHNDGRPHTYSVPLHEYFQGTLTQLRFHPAILTDPVTGVTKGSVSPRFGESFSLDWLAVIDGPSIHKVEGCIDRYYPDRNRGVAVSNVTAELSAINGVLPMLSTGFHHMEAMPYASTYNCYRSGGQWITITGAHFGVSPFNVTVGGRPCTQVTVLEPQTSIRCLLPPGEGRDVEVAVSNGRYPGLRDAVPFLSYQVPPPAPLQPVLSNLAACSVDISWQPPGDYWDMMTVTGYSVRVREGVRADGGSSREFDVTVGNVTLTTLTGLSPDTQYDFAVAAIAENQTDVEWRPVDLYGRRPLVRHGLVGPYSTRTNLTATLPVDFSFKSFTANLTVDHGPAASPASSQMGPTGVMSGEGHYGLVLVGDANVQGCNASHWCCDTYNATHSHTSCAGGYMCSAGGSVDGAYENHASPRSIDSNKPGGFKKVRGYDSWAAGRGEWELEDQPWLPCGPALRLTDSMHGLTGAAWYNRQVEVREGFETSFRFRLSSPSQRCMVMDDVYTHCRSRGGDGFAFVMQLESDLALGKSGMGLGYEEIDNSLAVEFDSYHNFEQLEPYENHVSVHTRGWRQPNSANHTYSLASGVRIPDLADGRVHVAKIRYEPFLDESQVLSGLFDTSPHGAQFLVNAEFPTGGQGDWGVGLGLLSVYIDDLFKPIFVTPLNLDATLRLNRGRAWVGFTAATGEDTWQVHDILDWSFTSLRLDAPSYPTPVVNGVGVFECGDAAVCVHH